MHNVNDYTFDYITCVAISLTAYLLLVLWSLWQAGCCADASDAGGSTLGQRGLWVAYQPHEDQTMTVSAAAAAAAAAGHC
jgi:hypothetical protein